MWGKFKFWLFGGITEFSQLGIGNGKIIADEFFLRLERWPLQRFWEIGNSQSDDEDCPYSYFKSIAVKKLTDLIDTNSRGKSSVVISPPLWKRFLNKYFWRPPRQSFQGGGDSEPKQRG